MGTEAWMRKAQKETIQIEAIDDRIRLHWSYQPRRFCLALGLPATKVNLRHAEQIKFQIELDILAGHFDLYRD